MDTQNVVDLSFFVPQDTGTLEILKPGGLEGIGWHITFAGPSHPKTIAYNNARDRKNLRKAQQVEQAQINGKKFKVDEQDVEEVRRETISWVVSRIITWTPVRLGGEPIEFSEQAAIELLLRHDMGWAFTQMVEFLVGERSFTKGSAKSSEPSQSTTSPSQQ